MELLSDFGSIVCLDFWKLGFWYFSVLNSLEIDILGVYSWVLDFIYRLAYLNFIASLWNTERPISF